MGGAVSIRDAVGMTINESCGKVAKKYSHNSRDNFVSDASDLSLFSNQSDHNSGKLRSVPSVQAMAHRFHSRVETYSSFDINLGMKKSASIYEITRLRNLNNPSKLLNGNDESFSSNSSNSLKKDGLGAKRRSDKKNSSGSMIHSAKKGGSGGNSNSGNPTNAHIQDDLDWIQVSDDDDDDIEEVIQRNRTDFVRPLDSILSVDSSPNSSNSNYPSFSKGSSRTSLFSDAKRGTNSDSGSHGDHFPSFRAHHGLGLDLSSSIFDNGAKSELSSQSEKSQLTDDQFSSQKPNRAILGKNNMQYYNQSYLFTQSGTIFVDGFDEGIHKYGIGSSAKSPSNLETHELSDILSRSQSPAVPSTYPNGISSTSMSMKGENMVDIIRDQVSSLLTVSERLVILGRLGQGASSVVYKALDIVTMKIVAVKMIAIFDRGKRRQMVRELATLFDLFQFCRSFSTSANESTLKDVDPLLGRNINEYVVDFFDAFSNLDEGRVALMMEYMDGGSLQDIVDDGGNENEDFLAFIAYQCLLSLHFLHAHSLSIHRDVKPSNFLISRTGHVKIADMGILKQFDRPSYSMAVKEAKSKSNQSDLLYTKSFVGTSLYMSPERLDGMEYTFNADIWSLGMSLLTLALGRNPLSSAKGYWAIVQAIREEDGSFGAMPQSKDVSSLIQHISNEGKFSSHFVDFLSLCLIKDPSKRATAERLLSHDFLRSKLHEMELQRKQNMIHLRDFREDGVREFKEILKAMESHIRKLRNDIFEEQVLLRRSYDVSGSSSMEECKSNSLPSSVSSSVKIPLTLKLPSHILGHRDESTPNSMESALPMLSISVDESSKEEESSSKISENFRDEASISHRPKLTIAIHGSPTLSNNKSYASSLSPSEPDSQPSNLMSLPVLNSQMEGKQLEKIVLGNVVNQTVRETLMRIFSSTASCSPTSIASLDTSRFHALSTQLYVDVEELYHEAEKFCDALMD